MAASAVHFTNYFTSMPDCATHLYFQLYPSYNTNPRLVLSKEPRTRTPLAKFLGGGGQDPQHPYGCAYDVPPPLLQMDGHGGHREQKTRNYQIVGLQTTTKALTKND